MFSYYGSKTKLAGRYPAPEYDTIIEPFAGAAGYSLYGDNWRKNVILYDSNPKISKVWEYLINATEKDILALPDLATGDKVTNYPSLTDAERWLIGFSINRGSSVPKVTASKRSDGLTYKRYLCENLHKIRHWKVFGTGYDSCENQEATWYIDPPYQQAGKYYYGYRSMDYTALGKWVLGLKGQVIVCENQGATWLPFKPLAEFWGSTKTQVEVIYLQENGLPLS